MCAVRMRGQCLQQALWKNNNFTVSKIYYIDGLDNLSCSASYHPNFSGSAAWQSTIALSVLVLRGVSVDMVPKFIIINLSKFIGNYSILGSIELDTNSFLLFMCPCYGWTNSFRYLWYYLLHTHTHKNTFGEKQNHCCNHLTLPRKFSSFCFMMFNCAIFGL